jgi:hypothetical protein
MGYTPRYKLLSELVVVSLAFFFLALVLDSALAESRAPHRTPLTVSGLREQLSRIQGFSSTSAGVNNSDREEIIPVTIHALVYGEGHVHISLPIKRNFGAASSFSIDGREIKDTTVATFLQGKIAVGGGLRRSSSSRVSQTALSVINNKLRITFLGRRKGSKGRQRLHTIHAILGDSVPSIAHVSSISAHAAKDGACSTPVEDVDGHRHATNSIDSHTLPQLNAQALVATRVATLSTDADREWFAKFGTESNAEILRVINTSEALFFRNFGVTFRVIKQHTYTDSTPYTVSRADYLLSQFVRNPENPINLSNSPETFESDVDLKHLFTGKTLEGNILGIAYIGSLCATPHLAYGVTQAHTVFDATFGIFAHEVSHSLGAFHDVSAPGTVMYPSISIPPTGIYSTRSLSEIRGFLLRSNACLSTEFVDRPVSEIPGSIEAPVLPPRTLTLKKHITKAKNVIRLSGTLTEGQTSFIKGATINLVIKNSVVATTTTNSKGKFLFSLSSRLFSKRGTAVYAVTDGWETTSAPLSVTIARSRR